VYELPRALDHRHGGLQADITSTSRIIDRTSRRSFIQIIPFAGALAVSTRAVFAAHHRPDLQRMPALYR
jgi:hypothetical protein